MCLPKVLGNAVDFWILMQNSDMMEVYDMVEFDRARNLF